MPPVNRGVPSPRGVAAETVPPPRVRTERVKQESAPPFAGEWVALDGAVVDAHHPPEGSIVDHDRDLARLCARLRHKHKTNCCIVRR